MDEDDEGNHDEDDEDDDDDDDDDMGSRTTFATQRPSKMQVPPPYGIIIYYR